MGILMLKFIKCEQLPQHIEKRYKIPKNQLKNPSSL